MRFPVATIFLALAGLLIISLSACGSDTTPNGAAVDMGSDTRTTVDMRVQDASGGDDSGVETPDASPDMKTDATVDAENSQPDMNDAGDSNEDMDQGTDLVIDPEYELHYVFCSLAFECPTPRLQLLLEYGRYDSVEDCRASPPRIVPILADAFAESLIAQAEGRSVVTGSQEDLDECRQEQFDSLCDGTGDASACSDLIMGTGAEGDPCTSSEECASGSCDAEVADECYNTCTPPSGCDLCTDDEYCIFGPDTCSDRKQLGEDCAFAQCALDLVCNASDECVLPRQTIDGEACDSDEECVQGSRCISDMCAAITLLDLNDTCSADSETSFCRAGTVCADLADGMGTCQMPRSRDESCASTRECYGDLACVGGICGDRKSAGEPCIASAECLSSICQGTCLDPQTPDVCVIP